MVLRTSCSLPLIKMGRGYQISSLSICDVASSNTHLPAPRPILTLLKNSSPTQCCLLLSSLQTLSFLRYLPKFLYLCSLQHASPFAKVSLPSQIPFSIPILTSLFLSILLIHPLRRTFTEPVLNVILYRSLTHAPSSLEKHCKHDTKLARRLAGITMLYYKTRGIVGKS